MLMQGYEPLALQTKDVVQTQYNMHTEGGFTDRGQHVSSENESISTSATNYHWAMRNVPALRDEPFMTTPRDYVARINFEMAGQSMPGRGYQNVAGNWETINTELLSSTGRAFWPKP
jgi:hypothetical protein